MRRRLIHGALALMSGVVAFPSHAQPRQAPSAVEAEAQAFMKAYADDLRAHRREAIAARYSRKGAFFPAETAAPLSLEAIGNAYRGKGWKGPGTFEWRDLAYEVLSPDAVVITGSLLWGADSTVRTVAYTGVLVRESGALRIRVEHESPRPSK